MVESAVRTTVGLVRERNEDAVLVLDLDTGFGEVGSCGETTKEQRTQGDRGLLMAVCDGMGGARGGEVASEVALHTLGQSMLSAPLTDERSVLARHLRKGVRAANQAVRQLAKKDRRLLGMGTTVTAMAFAGKTVVVANVGDSRAYVLRRGSLTQLTRDQSVVSLRVDAGELTEEEAALSPEKGVILQALGTQDDVEVSLCVADLCAEDRLLICTDGLHDYVDPGTIAKVCLEEQSVEKAASRLISLSNKAGGLDNTSVVLARVTGEGLPQASSADSPLRFMELAHDLEGEDALTTSSMVARRLARRAGIGSKSCPIPIPATSQYPIVLEEAVELARAKYPSPSPSLASSAIRARAQLGRGVWLAAACILFAVFVSLLVLWG